MRNLEDRERENLVFSYVQADWAISPPFCCLPPKADIQKEIPFMTWTVKTGSLLIAQIQIWKQWTATMLAWLSSVSWKMWCTISAISWQRKWTGFLCLYLRQLLQATLPVPPISEDELDQRASFRLTGTANVRTLDYSRASRQRLQKSWTRWSCLSCTTTSSSETFSLPTSPTHRIRGTSWAMPSRTSKCPP